MTKLAEKLLAVVPGEAECTNVRIEPCCLMKARFPREELAQRYAVRAGFLRVRGARRVMRVVLSVNTSRPANASLTAFELGKALAIAGSNKATEVPAATAE
jgi:hypothetical protein